MSKALGASVVENRGSLYKREHLPFEAGARQALRCSNTADAFNQPDHGSRDFPDTVPVGSVPFAGLVWRHLRIAIPWP